MNLIEKRHWFLSDLRMQSLLRCTPCLMLFIDEGAIQNYCWIPSVERNWPCARFVHLSFYENRLLESRLEWVLIASHHALNYK
jgi:hypothetical protein